MLRPPIVISTEARSETTSGAEKSLTLYACFCNVHLPVFYTLTLLSPCKILRLRASLLARYSAQDDRGHRVYAACVKRSLPAACRRCLIPRTASCRGHVPRTRVITLYNLIPWPARVINNITMPRSGRRLRRAAFYYLKQIARARHPTLCWVMRIGAFAFAEHITLFLSLAQNRGFCAIGAAATERGCRPRFTWLA